MNIWLALRSAIIPLSIFGLLGCAVTRHTYPKVLQRIESDADAQGAQIDNSYSNFVSRWPGFTVTGSASHIIGKESILQPSFAPTVMMSTGNAPTLKLIWYPRACTVSADTQKELRELIDDVYGDIGSRHNWRDITISMHLVPPNVDVKREIIEIRPGRSVNLHFYFSCSEQFANRDIFHGLLTSLHEVTHTMLSLRTLDGPGPLRAGSIANEEMAESGPACVYEHLRHGQDTAGLYAALPPDLYFDSSWELGESTETARRDWCSRWVRIFR